MKTQITSTIVGLILGLGIGPSFVRADESFHDDFTNPDPTNPDREPVTWGTWAGDDIVIENENLITGNSSCCLGGASVGGFSAQDVLLEAQFRILEGTNAAIGYLPGGVGGNVTTSSNPFWPLHAELIGGNDLLVPAVPIDFDPSEEDVVMRLQILGGQLSLWVWPANEPRPEEPLVTAPRPLGLSDTLVAAVDDIGGGPASRAEFRYFEAEVIPPVPGDFNSDRVLDVRDIDLLTAESATGDHDPAFDLTGDSLVDENDVDLWVKDLKKTWIGDADVNLEFNSSDMVQVFAAGKYETGEDAVWSEGDWNGSGLFDSSDMVAAFADGGYEKGPPMDAAVVPEPTAVLLLIPGLISVAIFRRRLRS